jgi:hypothetical protein
MNPEKCDDGKRLNVKRPKVLKVFLPRKLSLLLHSPWTKQGSPKTTLLELYPSSSDELVKSIFSEQRFRDDTVAPSDSIKSNLRAITRLVPLTPIYFGARTASFAAPGFIRVLTCF